MKKLAVLFAGLSLFVATSCEDKDDPVVNYPITGTWQPIKETWTNVDNDGIGVSDEVTYTDCEKESRWKFETASTGRRVDNKISAGTGGCAVFEDRTFSYIYDGNGDDNFQIKYQGNVLPDLGKVTKLTETEMNIKIEFTDTIGYHSKTYTFKRIE